MATVTPDRLDRAIEQTREALQALEDLRAEHEDLRTEQWKTSLLGYRELAELLQIDRPELGRRRRQGRIPAPIAELAAGPVWLRAQFTWPNTLGEEAS